MNGFSVMIHLAEGEVASSKPLLAAAVAAQLQRSPALKPMMKIIEAVLYEPFLVGMLIIVGMIWSFIRNRAYLHSSFKRKSIVRLIMALEALVGIIIGWQLTFTEIPVSKTMKLEGFPISIGGDYNDGSESWSYASPFAIFALFLNPLFGIMLLQLYGAVRSLMKSSTKA